jgi:hypothetical protein
MTARTPDGYEIAACGSCQAPIIWATSTGGRPMPVDAEPDASGTVELSQYGEHAGPAATILRPPVLRRRQRAGAVLRKAHHQTCSQRGQR